MNRYLTCLFFTGLLRAAPAVARPAQPPPTGVDGRDMNDTTGVGRPGGVVVTGNLQVLKTTHSNYVMGGSLAVIHPLGNRFELGPGAEVSYAPYHLDNGWHLRQLYFLPVFVVARFNLIRTQNTTVYLHTDQGISQSRYQKQDILVSAVPYKVLEYGYYTYGGGGIRWRVARHMLIQAETGFKSFHLSGNELAVNPHGPTIQVGLTVH